LLQYYATLFDVLGLPKFRVAGAGVANGENETGFDSGQHPSTIFLSLAFLGK
jgi:hypothetical protein